jgi:hypothetical protein
MRRSSRSIRTLTNLPESLHHQLNAYALAATAAGVSALALAQPAEAKIVYTPAHVKIGFGGVQIYCLDLNHDGICDFRIANRVSAQSSSASVGVRSTSGVSNPNRVVVGARLNAVALFPGAYIGPKRRFWLPTDLVFEDTHSGSSTHLFGYWANVRNRYVGLKFKYGGKTHYGWARLNVKAGPRLEITALLTGYAYEMIPNKAIIAGRTKGSDDASVEESNAALAMPAPKPATLGMLALGAPGLSIWRREEREVAAR